VDREKIMQALIDWNFWYKSQFTHVPKNFKDYMSWRMKESRLVVKDGKAFLKVVFEKPREDNVELKKSIAVDVNMSEIVVGKDDINYVRIPTRLHEVYHWKCLAENLQRKYPRR